MSWTSGRAPVSLGAAIAAAAVVACGAALAADLPGGVAAPAVPPGATPDDPRAAARVPALALALPSPDRPPLFRSVDPASAPLPAAGLVAPPTGPFRADAAVRRLPGAGFPDRLLARMEHEARRFRSERLFDVSAGLRFDDSVAEELRATEAERIFTRSFDRAMDDQLELLARTRLGLGGLLDWLDDFGSSGRAAARGPSGAGPARPAGRPSAGIGLRIGAHPRVVLRGAALGFKGRIEVPVLDEPLRLSIERPLGVRGRAVLTGGVDRDGADWATLAVHLRF
jgi:hypothetical protein